MNLKLNLWTYIINVNASTGKQNRNFCLVVNKFFNQTIIGPKKTTINAHHPSYCVEKNIYLDHLRLLSISEFSSLTSFIKRNLKPTNAFFYEKHFLSS